MAEGNQAGMDQGRIEVHEAPDRYTFQRLSRYYPEDDAPELEKVKQEKITQVLSFIGRYWADTGPLQPMFEITVEDMNNPDFESEIFYLEDPKETNKEKQIIGAMVVTTKNKAMNNIRVASIGGTAIREDKRGQGLRSQMIHQYIEHRQMVNRRAKENILQYREQLLQHDFTDEKINAFIADTQVNNFETQTWRVNSVVWDTFPPGYPKEDEAVFQTVQKIIHNDSTDPSSISPEIVKKIVRVIHVHKSNEELGFHLVSAPDGTLFHDRNYATGDDEALAAMGYRRYTEGEEVLQKLSSVLEGSRVAEKEHVI